MRIFGKAARFIIGIIALIEILANFFKLFSSAPVAVDPALQQAAIDNHNNQKAGAVGLLVFWVIVLALILYLEKKRNKKQKAKKNTSHKQ